MAGLFTLHVRNARQSGIGLRMVRLGRGPPQPVQPCHTADTSDLAHTNGPAPLAGSRLLASDGGY